MYACGRNLSYTTCVLCVIATLVFKKDSPIVYDSMCMCVCIVLILHCIAYFPECGSLPSSFSQGLVVADESTNASVASYQEFSSVCQGLIWLNYSTAELSIAVHNTTTHSQASFHTVLKYPFNL